MHACLCYPLACAKIPLQQFLGCWWWSERNDDVVVDARPSGVMSAGVKSAEWAVEERGGMVGGMGKQLNCHRGQFKASIVCSCRRLSLIAVHSLDIYGIDILTWWHTVSVLVSMVTTCLENLEMSGNLTAVREMSGILLKIREMSGKKILSWKVA